MKSAEIENLRIGDIVAETILDCNNEREASEYPFYKIMNITGKLFFIKKCESGKNKDTMRIIGQIDEKANAKIITHDTVKKWFMDRFDDDVLISPHGVELKFDHGQLFTSDYFERADPGFVEHMMNKSEANKLEIKKKKDKQRRIRKKLKKLLKLK
tara:strand:+ start:379 stop:846 length:468 start_codon:yes stop_codon:yes gene_type:complete